MEGILDNPTLHTDFDGTAVEKLSAKNPRNWLRNLRKYPLEPIDGYERFVRGVTNSGVTPGKIISRRPGIPQRIGVTMKSLGCALDLDDVFPEESLLLMGSDRGKAMELARQSLGALSTGMLEDRPDRLVPLLVDELQTYRDQPEVARGGYRPILIGVVGDETERRIGQTFGDLVELALHEVIDEKDFEVAGGEIRVETFSITIVPVGNLNSSSGEFFGNRIIDLAVKSEGVPEDLKGIT